MNGLWNKADIEKSAQNGEPIRFGDLMVYPLTVEDYRMFYACEPALEVRLSMLPAAYAIRTYADALYAMAINEDLHGTIYGTYFAKFIKLVSLSTRVPMEMMKPVVDMNDQSKLKALILTQETAELGETLVRLETGHLAQLRQLIAELNGKTIPDESENAELIQAENDIRSSGPSDLVFDMQQLKASVASYMKVRIKELDSWTIYEFEMIRNAMERTVRCVMCGIGESSGCKWDKGNPFPSLFFDRAKDNPGIIGMNEFRSRIGGAVTETDNLPGMPTNFS